MLAVLAAAVIAQAGAPPGAPLHISDCSITRWQSTGGYPYWNPFYVHDWRAGAPVTDGIRISFVNRSDRVADRVAFLVNYRGEVERIVDEGTFSPGVTIDHTFGNFSGYAYLGPRPNFCRVVAVRFRDGSIWRAPRRQATDEGLSSPRRP